MVRRLHLKLRRPALLAFFIALGAAATAVVTGCGGCNRDGDPYPANVTFEPRAEWIVISLPTSAPEGLPEFGKLDQFIQGLNAKGGKVFDPATIPQGQRESVNKFLEERFGTPNKPTIKGDAAVSAAIADLGIDEEKLAQGSKLYRRHCLQCHGLAGDGRGSSGPWLEPPPRDFRQAVFKFTSVDGTGPRKATRDDLKKTLTRGITTTAMPSFGLLDSGELDRLVDYTIYLAIRGRVEFDALKAYLVQQELDDDLDALLNKQVAEWQKAQRNILAVPQDGDPEGSPGHEASIRRGYQLFTDVKGAGCVSCHPKFGQEAKLQYDVQPR